MREIVNGAVKINKPEAEYTLIYGRHDQTQNPQQLPNPLDGLYLENIINFDNANLATQKLRADKQYGEIIKELERRGTVPIYLPEIETTKLGTAISIGSLLILGTEAGLSLTATQRFLRSKATRRHFLKTSALGITTGWLQSSFLPLVSFPLEAVSPLGKTISFVTEKLHPEYSWFTLQFRNRAAAYKMQWLAEKEGDSPKLASIYGSMHRGLEEEIQSSLGQKIDSLGATKKLWINLIKPSSFKTLPKYEFDGDLWRQTALYEIPELAKLVELSHI